MKRSRSGKGCWYLIEVDECPVCARTEITRTRQYTPRPKDPAKRYRYTQTYDYCNAL